MRTISTFWHIAFFGLVACSSTHTRDECPGEIGTCMDACCERSAEPTFDADCSARCPTGYHYVDRCAPAPSCPTPDGGVPDAGVCEPRDAGPIAPCWGGSCCDQRADPIFCGPTRCPEGYSWDCEVDPRAFCEPTWLECERASDCHLAPASCCLPCDVVTLEDVTAVNERGAAAHRAAVCPDSAACPPCAPPETPHLVATCAAMRCEAIDLRQHAVSACARDDQCRLRVPDCCECGADLRTERLIAVRADAAIEPLVCDPESACPECAPVYPDSVEAYCAPDGHCAVRAAAP